MRWLAQPWPWWVAGAAIGLVVTLFAFVTGKALGVSSGFGGICAACMPGVKHFQRKPYTDSWRLWFIVGIPLGGLLGAALAGKVGIVSTMGLFDTTLSANVYVRLAVLFAGGALAGFGARWADG